jgi:DNA processing protein
MPAVMGKAPLEILEGSRLPPRVHDLDELPERLYLHGSFPRGPAVAIVGTRQPTLAGEQYARHLAGVLAREGVAIFSGGAAGIDSAAHRGALDVGGMTVVVAPSGFDRPFPIENAGLFREIVERGGGFISSHAPDVVAAPPAFFARNRLLAALVHVLIVAEAPYRSGARNAAAHARALGRTVFTVAHAPWNLRGVGWAVELGLGAKVLDQPKRVLRVLRDLGLHPLPLGPGPAPVPPPVEPMFAVQSRKEPQVASR